MSDLVKIALIIASTIIGVTGIYFNYPTTGLIPIAFVMWMLNDKRKPLV